MEEKENLRKELEESANRMAEFKNAGMYEKEAEEHIKYSEITEKIEAENKYYEEEDLIAEIEEGREELNNSAKYMQQLKENGYYDRESAEHVRYSEIAQKLSNSEQKLAGIQAVRNEKVAKLQDELTKSANKMREYEENGFYDQEAAEYSHYSEIISEIDAVKRINHREDNRDRSAINTNNTINKTNPLNNQKPVINPKQPSQISQPIQLNQEGDNKNNKLVVFGTGIGYTIKKLLNKIKKLFRKFIKNNIEADAEYEEYEETLRNNDNKSAESVKENEFKDLSKKIEKTTMEALKQKNKEEKKKAKEEKKNARKSQTREENLDNSNKEAENTRISTGIKNNGRSSMESDVVLDEKIKRHLDSVAKTKFEIYQRQQEKTENRNNQNDRDVEDR
jgi:hypothetical protein